MENFTNDKHEEAEQLSKIESFQKIIENSSDVIFICNPNGDFTYVNQSGIKVSGYSKEEFLKMNFLQVIRHDFLSEVQTFYKNQFDSRTLNSYLEFPVVTKQGKEIWVGQSVQTQIKNDRIIGFHAITRNITDRKEMEFKLIEAKNQAEQSTKAKELFLSVMSHEIRTPLNAIVGIADLLLEETPTKVQKEYFNGLKYSCDNLLSIVNDILDFSKINSDKLTLENVEFDLKMLLKSTQEITKIAAIKKGLNVELIIDSSIPQHIKGDPVRLNQILINLISNAIKFTHSGKIELIIYNKKETPIDVTLQFVVKDTGIGIAADKLQHVFEPFSQVAPDTSRKYGGSGLGLSICKKLVDLMNGKIKVTSEPGKGSVFKVDLFFEKGDKAIAPKQKSKIKTRIPNDVSILVVEDNEMNQFVLRKNFEKWHIRHDEAYDGKQALELLKIKSYSLILLDLEIPEINGYELCKHIRSNGIETPIIIISATINPKAISQALSKGANDSIPKPINMELLLKKIIHYTAIQKKVVEKKLTPGAKNASNTNLIDLTYLINSSAGDKIFVRKMINSFIKNTPDYLAKLQEFLDQNNLSELRTEAHKFRATINIMGIESAKILIEKLEESIEENKNLDKLPHYLKQIINISEKAREELKQMPK